MNPDFLDIIRALLDAEARFIIVGAYALNLYIDPRATGDLDIWVEATRENARKVTIPFLSKAALIRNKRATGRPKDLLDLEELEKP